MNTVAPPSRRRARGCSQRPERVLAAVHAQSRLQEEAAAHLARQGHALLHPRGARDPRRHGGSVVLQRRAQPALDRGRDPAPGGGARFLADLPVRPSPRVPARLAHRRTRAGRSRSCVLLQFRLRGLRHGAQDRARLSQCARAGLRARASSAASAAITASASAAFRSAAWSTTASTSARCSPASTICPRPTTASIRPSPRASRNGAPISPTRSRASSRCTTRPPSPR